LTSMQKRGFLLTRTRWPVKSNSISGFAAPDTPTEPLPRGRRILSNPVLRNVVV
jgi:hypothetical protein